MIIYVEKNRFYCIPTRAWARTIVTKYKFSRRMNLIKYLGYFETFLKENNYSLSKVRLLSALIYLNIASLHHHPYSDLLFFHGKLTLSELLKK